MNAPVIGDRITFRAATRNSDRKVTRVVTSIWPNGDPCVRYEGCRDFVVHEHEVIEVLPAVASHED